MYILIILLAIISSVCVFLFVKYLKLDTKLKTLIKDTEDVISRWSKPLRFGYYTIDCSQTTQITNKKINYKVIIQIEELDRYTNGESLIQLRNIEIVANESGLNKLHIDDYVKSNFSSIIKTSAITWLESEQTIKEQRLSKLKQLKESIKQKK